MSRSRPSSSVSRHHRAGWRRRRPGTRLAAPPSVGVCGSRSESSRPARCVFGADPRPALAMLLPAAAGVGGGGLLGRRAPRSSARPGLCSSRLSLAFLAAREHESLHDRTSEFCKNTAGSISRPPGVVLARRMGSRTPLFCPLPKKKNSTPTQLSVTRACCALPGHLAALAAQRHHGMQNHQIAGRGRTHDPCPARRQRWHGWWWWEPAF